MRTKLTWAAALSILMTPLISIGLLDPLEGIVLLIPGIILGAIVRILSQVKFPRFTWISFTAALVLMAATIGVAIIDAAPRANTGSDSTVENPLMQGVMIGEIPLLIIMLWIARLANLIMVAGLIFYSVKIFRTRSSSTLGIHTDT